MKNQSQPNEKIIRLRLIFRLAQKKKTLLWCKIKRTPRFDFPLHRLLLTKGSRPSHSQLNFFKTKTYCNSLSGESVCRISA